VYLYLVGSGEWGSGGAGSWLGVEGGGEGEEMGEGDLGKIASGSPPSLCPT
jgi:hypothetical protein